MHHRELRDNYPALGIRLNSLLLQLHIITNPESCIRSPSCQFLLLSIPGELQTQQTESEKTEVGYHVGTQTTVTKYSTSKLLINPCVWVAHIYSSCKHHIVEVNESLKYVMNHIVEVNESLKYVMNHANFE